MNEEKQQKFTAKVRRGLVWVHSVAGAELACDPPRDDVRVRSCVDEHPDRLSTHGPVHERQGEVAAVERVVELGDARRLRLGRARRERVQRRRRKVRGARLEELDRLTGLGRGRRRRSSRARRRY